MTASQKVLVWVSIFTAVLVVYVEFRAAGGFNPFAIWNLLPTAAGMTLMLATGSRRFAVGFGLTASAAVALVHLAWLFNWGGIATASSTGGLIFLFVPVYAVVAGAIVGKVVSVLPEWSAAKSSRRREA